jgi:glycosyltransferase involved in cell wall biosynthesis
MHNKFTTEKISIIIIAKNEEKYLPELLQSLIEQNLQDFELIIVDSNSKDRTREFAHQKADNFKDFKYLDLGTARGPAYARNRGEEIASHERLLFLDADTRLSPDFLKRLTREIARKNPDIASCPLRITEKKWSSNFGAIILNLFMRHTKPFYSAAYGACLISTKTVHKSISGFREDLAICEDCNYVKRARKELNSRFSILNPVFYSSNRRAVADGQLMVFLKYIGIHTVRMFTGKEFLNGEIKYDYN